MKPIHTDSWHIVYREACPACDLGLSVIVPWRADGQIEWSYGGGSVVLCPRCTNPLPEVDWNHGTPRLVAA